MESGIVNINLTDALAFVGLAFIVLAFFGVLLWFWIDVTGQ